MNRQGAISPARIYGCFVLVLACAMLFAAVATPWAQELLRPIDAVPLHRIFSRLMLLGMMVGTALLLMRARFAQPGVLGFHGPWPRFLRRWLLGLLAGLSLMTVALVPLFLFDLRDWSERVPTDSGAWLALVLKGLASGLAVALLEETFFRGAMQGTLQRRGATGWALFAVPVFYSAVHFLGREAGEPQAAANTWSGFVVWREFFSALEQPLRILDAFVALYFVGLLLALVRWRWGDLAGSLGLHAGFVAAIAVFRRISIVDTNGGWSLLVSSFDGLLGLWIAAIAAAACVGLWLVTRPTHARPFKREK